MKISIVIRTYNEAKHLPTLLNMLKSQTAPATTSTEIIIVDSGSNDQTLAIAKAHECRIIPIKKEDFTFGKSLNKGCEAASGDILVFISGHCIPKNNSWLEGLIRPLIEKKVVLTYGRQIGNEASRYSEKQVFSKYFPSKSYIPQTGYFCNNANAAILSSLWKKFPFDEEVTGLEDMLTGKRLLAHNEKIGYVAEACVYHLHDETWRQVKKRFERESLALQHIMPEVHLNLNDILRYIARALITDFQLALKERVFLKNFIDIISYRTAQYLGSYIGNNRHKKISAQRKESYFYPRNPRKYHE